MRAEQNPEHNTDQDVIRSVFGQAAPDMAGLSERDRRIMLREMERKNRMQTGNVNQQMYGGPPIVE